jgi:CheY-like chemotaxis protein
MQGTPPNSPTPPSPATPATDPREIHVVRNREEIERTRFLGALVSHDLNNALFALSGRVQLLKLRAQDPAVQKLATEIIDATKYFDQLLSHLHHACARPPVGSGPTVVRTALADAFREIARSAGPILDGAEAVASQVPADLSFDGEARALVSAVLQCAALHRSRGANRIRVSAETVAGGDQLRVSLSLEDDEGDWDGSSGPPSLLDGTFSLPALPLGAAHRAIRDFGGKVSAQPIEEGLRTCVSFVVRRGVPMPQNLDDTCATAAVPAPRARRILIADGEPASRAILVAALEAVDDDVETLHDPAALAAHDDLHRFDVLILDAGGGGLSALASLRARGVGTPVLLTVGEGLDASLDGAIDPRTRILRKPYRLDALDRELGMLADMPRA